MCRRCPFCAPSGRCLDRTIKSGRCGDWIWFVRYGKQIRRPYVRPHDPRTPAQLRSRARLSAASRKYSYSLTEKQQDACIAAGAKRRSRPRLGQSGPLTGQQYSIRREYVLQKAHGNGIKAAIAPQVPQPQKLNPTSWEPRRTSSRVPPGRHRQREGNEQVPASAHFQHPWARRWTRSQTEHSGLPPRRASAGKLVYRICPNPLINGGRSSVKVLQTHGLSRISPVVSRAYSSKPSIKCQHKRY